MFISLGARRPGSDHPSTSDQVETVASRLIQALSRGLSSVKWRSMPQMVAGRGTESGGSFSALGLLLKLENLRLNSWGEISV